MKTWTDKAKASFWSKVDQSSGADKCWPWMLSRTGSGYGQVNMGKSHGPSLRAHRVAYELTYGSIPPGGRGQHGTCVLHSCDNRICCNPKHLRFGTQADNVKEAYDKGRLVSPQKYSEEILRKSDAYPRLVAALQRARGALVKDGHRPGLSALLVETIDPLLRELGEKS